MRRASILVLGALAFLLATAAIWLMAVPSVGTNGGLAVALGESLGLPILVTLLVLRPLRRHDASTRFGATAIGLIGGCAVLTLLVVGLWARRPLAAALRAAPERHGLTGSIARASRGMAAWIAPAARAPAQHASSRRPGRTAKRAIDAGARTRSAPDASTVAEAPEPPRGQSDAGVAPPVEPRTPGTPEPRRTGSVTVCEGQIRSVFAAELGPQGVGDEVIVACDEGVRALWRLEDGRVLERTRITVHAPEGLELTVAEPRLIDVDEDARPDLLLGAYYTTERGGTRGGDTWWAPGQQDGQFGAPVRLAGGFCAGLDAGDIDGDGHVELVIVHVGNPWSPIRPMGEIRWYEREGRRFLPRGNEDLHRQPAALWLADVDRDGLLDAVVRHDWEEDDVVVLPGTPRGLGPIVEGAQAPPAPARDSVALRLDDDGERDRVRAAGTDLVFEATARLVLEGDTVTRALDHRAHDVGGPAGESTGDQ